jgi:transposase
MAGQRPGPRPVPDRRCLQGILLVLHTGIGWEDVPQELGFGSGMTCWRRLIKWTNPFALGSRKCTNLMTSREWKMRHNVRGHYVKGHYRNGRWVAGHWRQTHSRQTTYQLPPPRVLRRSPVSPLRPTPQPAPQPSPHNPWRVLAGFAVMLAWGFGLAVMLNDDFRSWAFGTDVDSPCRREEDAYLRWRALMIVSTETS